MSPLALETSSREKAGTYARTDVRRGCASGARLSEPSLPGTYPPHSIASVTARGVEDTSGVALPSVSPAKLFLSAASEEFRSYRDVLRSRLQRPNVMVHVQEDFIPTGTETLDKLDLYIKDCDAVVHLLGDRTGAWARAPTVEKLKERYPDLAERLPALKPLLDSREPLLSYTQWEAYLAIYHRKVLLIAQAAPEASRDRNVPTNPESQAAQSAHLERLRQLGRYSEITFTSHDQLIAEVFRSTVFDLLAKPQSDLQRDSVAVKIGGPLITGAIGAAIGVGIGLLGITGVFASALTALLGIAGGVSGLVFALMYQRYVAVLAAGGSSKGSPARNAYDRLRKSLSGGNLATRLYTSQLDTFLITIDRFFGDAGKADRTLFPRAFGLRTPAPLWTAAAFDRCLLLAFYYPILMVVIIWAVSGHVGPGEAALRLQSGLPGWERGIAIAIIVFSVLAGLLAFRKKGWWMQFTCSAVAITGIALAAAVILDFRAIEIARSGAGVVGLTFVTIIARIIVGVPDRGYYSVAGVVSVGGIVLCGSVAALPLPLTLLAS